MDNIEQEFERISALKITKIDKEISELREVFIPQIEIVKYNAGSGEIISKDFFCVSNGANVCEFDTELEALKYAMKVRDDDKHIIEIK